MIWFKPLIAIWTKYAVGLKIVLGIGIVAFVYAHAVSWSNDRCKSKMVEIQEKAQEDRQKLTDMFLREQRTYQERIRLLRGQVNEVANDNPLCEQPADVARLRNSAISNARSTGSPDGRAEAIRSLTGTADDAVRDSAPMD